MDRIGIRELQQHASGVLRRVRKGETLQVTERGHPVAVLIPERARTALEALRASGRTTAAEGDLLDLGPPIKRSRGATTAAKRLQISRQHER